MSSSNGVIRIGRKGKKQFAFGEEGVPGSEPFEIDVVEVFHQWVSVDDSIRPPEDDSGNRAIPQADMHLYHAAVIRFVESVRGVDVTSQDFKSTLTTAEALDFLARLREEYDALVHFFRPKSLARPESPDTSVEASTQFSEEK